MSWQAILQTLPLLNTEEAEIFAPPREMEAAIASYNRALVNLRNDSADIAQIALRKLVISYPLFGPASLLYGACMLEQGRLPAAAELIDRAKLAGLKPQENRLAESLVETINQQRTEELQPANPGAKTNPGSKQSAAKPSAKLETKAAISGQPAGSSVLERTHRPTKTRMASRKEVQNVMRHGDVPEQEVTKVFADKTPQEKLRLAVIALGSVAALVVLLFLGTLAVKSFNSARTAAKAPNDKTRLDYLLNRLEQLSSSDAAVAGLLSDYDKFITPVVTTMPEATSQAATSSAQAETKPSVQPQETTPTTTGTSEPVESTSPTDLLTQVYSEYQAALILAKTDVVTAAEALLKVRKTASGLDSALTSPAVPMTVNEMIAKIDASLGQYSGKAAETLRVQGKTAYDLKDYQTSLDRYLRAYQLVPLYYNGAVAYYCGRNYQALKQYDLAKPYYELVIEKFPGKDLANFAVTRLNEMGFTVQTAPAATTTAQPTTVQSSQ